MIVKVLRGYARLNFYKKSNTHSYYTYCCTGHVVQYLDAGRSKKFVDIVAISIDFPGNKNCDGTRNLDLCKISAGCQEVVFYSGMHLDKRGRSCYWKETL
jgi:hypothetical protein